MNRLHRNLLRIAAYRQLIDWSKSASLPGFAGLPLYTVLHFFFEELSQESILNKASSLAYNFLLAVFPGIIFLFTLIPYIPVDNFQAQLLELIQLALPDNAFSILQTTLEDIINRQNGGLLSAGFLLCTFFATNGLSTLMMSFNKASLAKESRSWLHRRLVALVLSLAVVLALALGIALYAGSNYLITYLREHIDYDLSWFWSFLIKTAQWIILFSVYFLTVSLVYKFGPSSRKNWKLFTPGASFATLLAVLSFSLFTFYINHFGAYNKLYGSIGTLIVVMIWMYINALILLIGFELNAAIALSKRRIKIYHPPKRRANRFKSQGTEAER